MPPQHGNGFFYSVRDVWDELQKVRAENSHNTEIINNAINGLSAQITAIALQIGVTDKWRANTDRELDAIKRWRYRLPVSVILAGASIIISALGVIFGGSITHR